MKKFAEGQFGDAISVSGNMAYPGYIIQGSERSVMIDAGINMLGPLYLKTLKAILSTEVGPDVLLVTHSHYDHLGAAPYLKRQMPHLKIGGSPRIEDLLKKASVLERMNALSEIQRALFGDIVGNEDVSLEPLTFTYKLKEGDTLSLGNLTCRVFETPGHTRDSLSYYIPELEALFPGESIGVPQGHEGEDVQVVFLSSYEDYVNSLKKLAPLQAKIIGMGHGWVFTGEDALDYFPRSLEATENYRRLIETYLDKTNGDVPKAIEDIVVKEYDEKGTIFQERNAYITNLTAQVQHIASLNGG